MGRGGMGTVYLAFDARSKQHVALKILPPKVAREEFRLLMRFQREMELSQKVQHPHLARTLEAGTHQHIHFIAMEYIPGQTLFRLVTGKGPLPVGRVAHLFAEVASALGQAHSQGVIHRDMKPSNIMVTPHDHAKVLDLGLAFTEGEEVEDIEVVGGRGYIVGSIDYMAPEQTRDPTSVDARADLYALGCCLYFALTGKPPFPEGKIYNKVRAHRHEPPTPIRTLNPDMPEAFAAIVHKLLAKSPDERFASANELAAALAPFRRHDNQPVETPNDAAFQDAVKTLIEGWTIPVAKEPTEDAVLFHVEVDETASSADSLSRAIFSEGESVQLYVWILGIVALWVALLMLCAAGSCVFFLTR
jgi:serine/threonine protein kinase